MQLSPPTVHEMIGRLERDGYITRGERQAISFTDTGREHAEGDRPPPPPDRALPHRRPRASRGTRCTRRPSGWSTRCRPVLEERMLAAIGDAKTCPHGHPIEVGQRASRACRWPTSRSARASRILRFENEAEDLLHYLKAPGLEPGHDRHAAPSDDGRRGRRRTPTAARRVVADAQRRGDGLASSPTRRRRRAPRCPSSSCSRATATGASAVDGAPRPGRDRDRRRDGRRLVDRAAARRRGSGGGGRRRLGCRG